MQFTCDQERFARTLGAVGHAVNKGTSAPPITTTIRLSTDQGRLRLDATNLELGITAWLEVVVAQEGSVSIPARTFSDAITALAPGQIAVRVETVTHDVQVHSQSGSFHVRGQAADEFPTMPAAEPGGQAIMLAAPLLKEVIREVVTATDESGSKPIFENVLLQMERGKVTFAATDGFSKVTYRTLTLAEAGRELRDILVPARALTELASILPADGMIEVSVTENSSQVVFSTQWLVLSSRLSSGKFPNYKAVLPRERQTRVTVKAADFRHAVQLSILFAKADSHAGHITIRGSLGAEPGTLTITSEAADVGGNQNTIPVQVEGDDQEEVIFNVSSLAKTLAVITTPDVVLEIGATKAPVGVLKAAAVNSAIHGLMSMTSAH